MRRWRVVARKIVHSTGGERRVRDHINGIHQVRRRLDDDAVIDAVYRIEPEFWLKQSGAIEFSEQARGDLLFGYANLERLGAIDVNLERRVVKRLGDSEIDQARNAAQLILERRGESIVGAKT